MERIAENCTALPDLPLSCFDNDTNVYSCLCARARRSSHTIHSECTVIGDCMVIRYAHRVFGGAETSWLQPHTEEEHGQ